ncbi:MAG: hypothetical protein IJM79_07530 [Erysipelotrichaceae bacterium]|nr:hypothetical protein [Erysipelotrichaceae bacterium]
MFFVIADLTEDGYNGIDRSLLLSPCKTIKRRKTEIDDRIGYYAGGVYYLYKDKTAEQWNLIVRNTDIDLNISKYDEATLFRVYEEYKSINEIIPCEMLVGDWSPIENSRFQLEFVGVDLVDPEGESLLYWYERRLFCDAAGAAEFLSEVKKHDQAHSDWQPFYVYRIVGEKEQNNGG